MKNILLILITLYFCSIASVAQAVDEAYCQALGCGPPLIPAPTPADAETCFCQAPDGNYLCENKTDRESCEYFGAEEPDYEGSPRDCNRTPTGEVYYCEWGINDY